MTTWAKALKTTTLAAVLATGVSLLGAAPATATPPDNASCTGRSVSNGAQNSPGPFGQGVKQFAGTYGQQWGHYIAYEAGTDEDPCPTPFEYFSGD
ncbi:hypothetical protein GCM10011374_38330 [Kocuria dechangensis]|uniref:Secreted protein n=1 Tax=Kocuria dechangensis TaxID=1176249 RepID=A0A917M176_9MICC|nr:hypothetical protein [Kocuria dechangensis]GGG70103.1 hypothetical protein GCM10011374_38330 [Kocuria dechangensis]